MNATLSILVRSFVLTYLLTFFLSFSTPGYGRSTGVPSPRDNSLDAKELVLHLKRNCRVPRLVVHGESIGGMAAAFAANQLPDLGEWSSPPCTETERRSIPSFLHFFPISSQNLPILSFCVIDLSVRFARLQWTS